MRQRVVSQQFVDDFGGPVGAALAAMRRQAQRENTRQGLAAPPLRATARIAAKAAPTRLANTNE
jgi:hypothetical protein